MTVEMLVYSTLAAGILALLYTLWKSSWVSKQDVGTEKMKKISEHIAEGAMAFLRAEYKVLGIFVLTVAIAAFVIIMSASGTASSVLVQPVPAISKTNTATVTSTLIRIFISVFLRA